jgi:hypothetical protein
VLYDDGRIACTDTALLIRWYYPWGAKRSRTRRSGPSSGGTSVDTSLGSASGAAVRDDRLAR